MNKFVVMAFVVVALAVLALGCGRSKTISTPGGKVTVTPKNPVTGGGSAKVETKEGTFTTSTEKQGKTISEAELGVPVYPGATVMSQSSYDSKEAAHPGGKQSFLLSTDSFEKVVAFYKSHLKDIKNEQNFSQADSKMAMFTIGEDKNATMVHITWSKDKNETMIMVVKQGVK